MSERPVDQLQSEIDMLRQQLAEVTARLSDLQRAIVPVDAMQSAAPSTVGDTVAAADAPATSQVDADLPEDIVIAISAAVAAFLGERARVRQIRLISSPAWAQQGRVSIQASHRLER